ncbi:tyrosine-type recombinase/integrase [Solidesulfovibrio magneticus]|uniref:Site-specific recombinase n=1 Tax=Solidesulfovibrio magneticus (strain ATCC 700980 / DSM 13731 / RS-1) TaxID=573370 RepID=C4XKW2_SOLM1|nr:site-specific integrase [Solidesulfovibrio magneticus]BAH74501.1 putative site-specific recombinase [Solidesulfovibrio magneticus RS-1]
MGIYQRDERWMVYWNHNGKRHDKSFGRGDLAQAKAQYFDRAVQEALAKGLPVPDPQSVTAAVQVAQTGSTTDTPTSQVLGQQPSGMLLSDLGSKYLAHMQASGRTEKHIRNIEHLVNHVFIPVLGDKPVNDLTYQDDMVPFIIHFQGVSSRTGKVRSQYTVNKYCDYLSFIFNFGIDNGFTSVNPLKIWKKPKVQPWDMKLTLDDAKKIMANAEPHLKWAMEVCFNLGTRPGESELLSLRWEDVDFKAGTVRIYASKTKTYRTVPINPEFLKRLEKEQAESQTGYVIEYMGRKLTTIRKAFKNACKRAGINYPTRMYDLRHLFATTLLRKGADLAAVSKMMGHSTVKMTADTYYHYMEGEKERAVRLLPELLTA